MENIFRDVSEAEVYIDDIGVFSDSWQQHQKQHHVPYSLAISINGTFLLKHGIASALWAFQYVFLIIYFRYFLFLVIFSCPSETVPYLRNYSF
jgi:hypothetical protein